MRTIELDAAKKEFSSWWAQDALIAKTLQMIDDILEQSGLAESAKKTIRSTVQNMTAHGYAQGGIAACKILTGAKQWL